MAEKIIPFPRGRVVEAVKNDNQKIIRRLQNGNVYEAVLQNQVRKIASFDNLIDRCDPQYWIKRNDTWKVPTASLRGQFLQMRERCSRIKFAFESRNEVEIITQSARVAIIAEDLGLPKTAHLSAEIGEAQMQGNRAQLRRLVYKLDSIIEALAHDLFREAK